MFFAFVSLLVGVAVASPLTVRNAAEGSLSGRSAVPPMVFAHYMLITRPTSGNYSTDMRSAKALGIDAFAVNYGGFSTDFAQQDAWLTEFYDAAAAAGMKAFLSVDTSITPTLSPAKIRDIVGRVVKHPAQLQVRGQPLLTSFELSPPTSWKWDADVVNQISPKPLFVGCSLSDSASNTLTLEANQGSAGAVTWLQPTLSADKQRSLDQATSAAKGDRLWIATVAPWFFKRLSADMNWAQAQDDAIFVPRWHNLLSLNPRPDFIEITTWNDWGESSYIGPADEKGSCAACYYDRLDHTGFQRIAKPFIEAFKNGGSGSSSVTAPAKGQQEEVFMFYRTQRAADDGDGQFAPPRDVQSLKDQVYVVGVLSAPATVTVTTGPTTTVLSLGAGVQQTGLPFGFGAQAVRASRNGKVIGSGAKTGPQISASVGKVNDNVVVI